jgi:hypothetical protein
MSLIGKQQKTGRQHDAFCPARSNTPLEFLVSRTITSYVLSHVGSAVVERSGNTAYATCGGSPVSKRSGDNGVSLCYLAEISHRPVFHM